MKRHVDVGADILSLVEFPYPVVPIVRCHHENWDGTRLSARRRRRGHSDRRADSVGRRLLRRADVGSAVSRPDDRRRRRSQILRERSGRMYDPHVVDTFIEVYREHPDCAGRYGGGAREVLQRIHAVAPRDRRAARTGRRRRRRGVDEPARVREPGARCRRRGVRRPTCWRWGRRSWPTSCPAPPAPGSCPMPRTIGSSSPARSARRRRRFAARRSRSASG